jgi:hypothetical protein
VTAAQDRDHKPDLLVDDDNVQCPTATFATIQDASNAASPGSLIRVCPGIYTEQLSSNKSLNKSLSIEGDDDAMLLPGNMVANNTGSAGTPIVAPCSSVATNQLGIHTGGQRDEIESNGISKSLGLVGIDLAEDKGLASRNDVTHSGQAVILYFFSKGFIP